MSDINVATAGGKTQKFAVLEDGTVVPVFVSAYGGAGVITDLTGMYRFDVNSLASQIGYDSAGNQTSIIYGPDHGGRYIKQTSTWSPSGQLLGDSAWQLVDASGAPL